MTVVNVDGPPVAIYVNGTKLAERSCQTADFRLRIGDGPSFPWTVEIRRLRGGESLRTVRVDGASGKPQLILVRAVAVLVGDYPASYGPAPVSPCPD